MSFGFRVGAPSAPSPAPIFQELLTTASLRSFAPAAVAELRSLARERDPELRLEGVLGLAQREQAAGRLEAAVELYATVVRDAPAVGVVRERPLRIRAQTALDAIAGRGALGPRAEFLLRNFAQQASDPTMLLAMGTAGAVFRMTRLATLSRLVGASNPGFMTQVLGAGRLASLAGLAAEGAVFPFAARLGNEALGRSQDWGASALGRDLASSYLLLGGLRFAGAASQALYRRFAGPVGANLVFALPIPALGRTQGSPLQFLFHQGGMLSGILLGHALEERLGLRQSQDGATTLLDSLALLLQFNLAGRLTRQAFGSRFATWERGLDLQSEALLRGPRFAEGALEGFSLETVPLPAGVGGMEPRGRRGFHPPNVVMMGIHDGEGGGKGREGSDRPAQGSPEPKPRRRGRASPDTTLPFPISAEEILRSASGEAPAFGKDPLEVESFPQLSRRIQDPQLNFREALREHDMEFRIQAPSGSEILPLRPERFIPLIVQYLNAASIGQAIPLGRSLVIAQEGRGLDAWRFALVKGNEGFECHPPLARTGEGTEELAPSPVAVEPTREPIADTEAAAKPPSDPPQITPRAVERGGAEEEAGAIPLRAQSLDSLARTLSLAARQSLIRGVSIPVLLETGIPRVEDLMVLNVEGVGEISERRIFRLFSTEGRRSFQGTLASGQFLWEEVRDQGWNHSAVFSSVAVRSVVELYQVLHAYARAEKFPAEAELTLRLRVAPPSRDSLAEFLSNTLDHHPLLGRRRLQVEFGTEEPPLNFRRGENDRWERE